MENAEVLEQRDAFISRVFGTPLQRRLVEAVWSPQYDEIMGKLLHQMIDTAQKMDLSLLNELVELLEHEDIRNSTAGNTAFILLIKSTTDEELGYWTKLMSRHFLRMHQYTMEDGTKLDDNAKLIIMDALVMYSKDRPDLTVEQEETLIRLTASDLNNENPAITKPSRNVNIRVMDDVALLDYVLANGHRVGPILKAMVEQRLTRTAQIDAYISGQTPSLTGGAL